MGLEVRVLGPVEVYRDGVPLGLRGRKRQGVLAVLALHAGAPVPVERCLEAVWGPDAPPGTRRSLHTYISYLRRALDPDRVGLIAYQDGAYRLVTGGKLTIDIDCVEFERLAGSENPADLDAALKLWRGDLSIELDGLFAQTATARLRELRLRTAQRAAGRLIDVGQADAAVELLATFVGEAPFDEQLWACYIKALSAGGRWTEALTALGRLRRSLAQELGLAPSAELQQLEIRVLRRDRSLRPAASSETTQRVERPTIAVLPFQTLGMSSRAFFGEGLAEDITTDLARCHELFVIAPSSVHAVWDQHQDIPSVAVQLGVRYVLEGSVQWWREHGRITARLIEGHRGGQLWSERYDCTLDDIFAVRDRVVADIVASLSGYHGHIVLEEKRRSLEHGPASLDVYEKYFRGLALKHRFEADTNREARALLLEAIEEQPNYARAHVAVAWTWLFDAIWGWSETPDLRAAWHHAERGAALDDLDAEAHWLLAELHLAEGHDAQGVAEYDRAKELNPNLADVHACWCWAATRLGMAEDGLRAMDLALRLNPSPPVWYPQFRGAALYCTRRYAAAIDVLLPLRVHTVVSRLYLAAALYRYALPDEAAAQFEAARLALPGLNIAKLERMEPLRDVADRAHLVDALRGLGLPE